ncbi:uncharacterized protein Z519_11328 [Cladophialophora bantiana CBS 173.52]|uniref:Fungal N-terminal domain-containing protein n=1 Tax=Cladophialophora bantiana (strain ATCC 10958 / CBS 173.52 / CDC B-1940 / NIH 8579) TaxID=1442370 RepID=A0A0D2FNB5_CLAB1|nr:uncharacterized protein Z519_11328 [Cladophialophora bantiana CBS 173.52]KIW88217.1 hypothetical protein Z519_11328 [Cladophialophora bantiana CBS 173.52]
MSQEAATADLRASQSTPEKVNPYSSIQSVLSFEEPQDLQNQVSSIQAATLALIWKVSERREYLDHVQHQRQNIANAVKELDIRLHIWLFDLKIEVAELDNVGDRGADLYRIARDSCERIRKGLLQVIKRLVDVEESQVSDVKESQVDVEDKRPSGLGGRHDSNVIGEGGDDTAGGRQIEIGRYHDQSTSDEDDDNNQAGNDQEGKATSPEQVALQSCASAHAALLDLITVAKALKEIRLSETRRGTEYYIKKKIMEIQRGVLGTDLRSQPTQADAPIEEPSQRIDTKHRKQVKTISEQYAEYFAHQPEGMAVYRGIDSTMLRPGMCGYFDVNGEWRTIVDLTDSSDLQARGLPDVGQLTCSLEKDQNQENWWIRRSNDVVQKQVSTPAAVDFPAPGGVPYSYTAKTDRGGAILVTDGQVTCSEVSAAGALHAWIAKYGKMIANQARTPSSTTFWLVTRTYSAPRRRIIGLPSKGTAVTIDIDVSTLETGNVRASSTWWNTQPSLKPDRWYTDDQNDKGIVLAMSGFLWRTRWYSSEVKPASVGARKPI